MSLATKLLRSLSPDEVQALSHYGADSTFLHAVAQGREQDLNNDPMWQAFWPKCALIVGALDSAIAASVLTAATVLHSAHGNGFGVRGSLIGDPTSFVGLTYSYPGYISTSSERSFCDRFLEPRRTKGSRPAMLEFHLPAGFNAIDMSHGGHAGEFEFLLGRQSAFSVIDASMVDQDVLSLVLAP